MRHAPLLALLMSAACTVHYPSGWTQRITPAQTIQATPWVVYSKAPRSWDSPDGERIHVDVVDATISFGFGSLRTNFYYGVQYERAPSDAIVCMSSPSGPGIPPTRFGCWSTEPGVLAFWLSTSPACDPGAKRTLSTPECWTGEGVAAGQPVRLEHAYFEETGEPAGYLVWSRDDGAPLLAADFVVEQQIQLFDMPHAQPTPQQRRLLVLLSVAMAFLQHASRS